MKNTIIKNGSRILLGAGLILAGTGHLTFARKEFKAQVPDWVPIKKDDTVLYSGFAEILLGSTLILAPKKYRLKAGYFAAGFFAAVLPGNVAQYTHRRSAFGLDSDGKRLARLFLQPVLIAWAIGSMKR